MQAWLDKPGVAPSVHQSNPGLRTFQSRSAVNAARWAEKNGSLGCRFCEFHPRLDLSGMRMLAEWTGLEPATPGVTGRYSNQLNYHSIVLLW